MTSNYIWQVVLAILLVALSLAASATRLEVNPEAHTAIQRGADLILYTHILGGAIGLIAGFVASIAAKGRQLHITAGKIFFIAMLACYTIAVVVAPFLQDGQRPNFIAGVLALYLLISGIQAARQKVYCASWHNIAGLIIAFTVAAMGLLFMYMGSQSETGTVDGSPPEAFVVFAVVGTLACLGEARILIIKQLSQRGRVIRHLWRMCLSFFFASGSLFFGQPQVFPEWFSASPLPGLLAIFPVLVLLAYLFKIGLQEVLKKLNLTRRPLS